MSWFGGGVGVGVVLESKMIVAVDLESEADGFEEEDLRPDEALLFE